VPAPEVHPALWKVEQGKTVIYLFGTVHALPAGVPWLDGKIADALDQSDTLVTEIIEKDPAAMRQIVMQTAMLPEGQTLRTKLTPRQRAALKRPWPPMDCPPPGWTGSVRGMRRWRCPPCPC
jgi:uncharacterized protein YbaP (TraB family)